MRVLPTLVVLLCHSAAATQSIAGYELDRPAASFRLPAVLREVSGVTDGGANTIVCVQDELGILFVVDANSGEVRERYPFAGKGDYEGVTRVGDDYWVLRSDGRLLRVAPRNGRYALAEIVDLELPHRDIEGIGYDHRNRLLLIAPKDQAKGDKDQRPVFAFDPEHRQLRDKPVLELSRKRLTAAAEQLGVELPTRTTKKKKVRIDLKLRFTCVAVHPITDEVWLLSAVDRLLVVVDRTGALVGMHFFGDALPQGEGITFLANGDVLLCSEGVAPEESAMVRRFAYSRPGKRGSGR